MISICETAHNATRRVRGSNPQGGCRPILCARACAAAIVLAVFVWADNAAGVQWTPPSSWKAQGPRPMRAATYAVPAAAGDKEDGECIVNYFGPGQGGPVDANVKRWIGQFEGGEKTAKTAKRTIHGLNVTTVDVSGTYSGMGGPMAPTKSVKPNYRMLGAIVEAPQGSLFFKFTGSAKTVAANQAKFEAMLSSITH